MWTIIDEKKIENYLQEYPELEENFDMYKLHSKDTNIVLPKLFYKNYPSNNISLVGEANFEPQKIDFEFKIDEYPLREEQQKLMNTIMPIYKHCHCLNGVIKARPGFGKSISTIYIASRLKFKTLIIVDTENLLKQWVREILKFTTFKPEEIGIIKQSHFGIEEPIAVGMVQTFLSKFKNSPKMIFEKMNEAGYGLVAFDEVHKSSSSEKYSKISTLFKTPNILGLSATPYKYGYQDILMKNVIGDIIFESGEYDLKPQVSFIFYESGLEKYKYAMGKITDYARRKAFYNKHLSKSEKFINVITKYCKQDVENDHRVIIVCWTKEQVKLISAALDNIGIQNRRFFGDERTYETTDKVLVVTYSFAGHGFDYKELSSIILACPLSGKVSLIQTIGRVLRECKGKNAPVVRDLVDLSFPTLFLPDLAKKKTILENEFSCEFNEIKEYDNGKSE